MMRLGAGVVAMAISYIAQGHDGMATVSLPAPMQRRGAVPFHSPVPVSFRTLPNLTMAQWQTETLRAATRARESMSKRRDPPSPPLAL